MKAFLLAAGLGTRLRPLTDRLPKCMLPVAGRPMLDLWLDAFSSVGVKEVLLNVHHHRDVIRCHIEARTTPPDVVIFEEDELLGSAGTLLANRGWVDNEEFFLVCNADNLTNFDLATLVDFHRDSDAAATLTVFASDDPSSCGIVEVDARSYVSNFVEKPTCPNGNLANAGIYAFEPRVLEPLSGAPPPLDVSYDLIPTLVGNARALEIKCYFRDIGTVDSYRTAQVEWTQRMAS